MADHTSHLQAVFKSLGKKVGSRSRASTTHLDKLPARIEAGGGGGCPIPAFGITKSKSNEEQIRRGRRAACRTGHIRR
ncbi:MAG: hypothetical protein IT536_18715 [Hyphomicrobiales bacterium]|nr:hypothetical protein [Hyphomicrobiales bacterium]